MPVPLVVADCVDAYEEDLWLSPIDYLEEAWLRISRRPVLSSSIPSDALGSGSKPPWV
jgi:hypothetical protein